MIALTERERDMIRGIISGIIPSFRVGVFGSRVTGRARKFSDIDLVVFTETPLAYDVTARLKEAFSESDLSFRVDITDWATTSEKFRNIILRRCEELYRPE